MFSLPQLLTTVLATHRITRLITTDVITEPLRDKIYETWGDPSTPQARYTPSFLVTCPHCASLYAAFAAALLTQLASPTSNAPRPIRVLASLILTALASAAAVSLYHEHVPAPSPSTHSSGGWASS